MRGLTVIGILRFLPIALLCMAPAAQAIKCDKIQIKAASLNSQPHSYDLVAECDSTVTQVKSEFSVTGAGGAAPGPGITGTTKSVELLAIVAYGDASWDIGSKIAKESVDFTGDVTGSRSAEAVCGEDPFLDTPPGRAKSCGPVKVAVELKPGSTTKFAAPTELLILPQFWFREAVQHEAAKALSKATAAETATPPPPPKQTAAKVMSSPSPLAGRETQTASTMPRACGNGTCEPGLGENCSNCADDCQCAAGQLCGNGLCLAKSSAGSTKSRACGNGTCEPGLGENCSSCADDCQCAAGQLCGNGLCLAKSARTAMDSGSDQACHLTVPYLQPMQPIIETAGDVRQGDQFRIVCVFRTASKELEWPSCNADNRRLVDGYRQLLQRSAGFRYSGMLDVNGVTLRVSASPPGAQSGFEIEHLAYQKDVGNVTVVCKVDNMLQAYVQGSPQYLENSAGLTVGARVQGRAPVGVADLPARGRVPSSGGPVAASDPAGNVVGRTLNPQPEVPTPAPAEGTSFNRVVAPGQATVTSLPGQPRMTESGSQPLPPVELPPFGIGVNSGGSRSGSGSGPGRVDPATQPAQPAAEGSVRPPGERLATPPEEVVLQRDSDKTRLTEPSTLPTPPEAFYQSLPQLQARTAKDRQLSTTSSSDTLTRSPAQPSVPAGTTNSGIAIPNPGTAGIEVECLLSTGNVAIVNTASQRLEKGTPVRWAVYLKGTELALSGWGVKWQPVDGTEMGETVLSSPLSMGQKASVGNHKLVLPGTDAEYACRASVLPLSQPVGRQ